MSIENTEIIEDSLAEIRQYCPNEGERMIYMTALTEFPDLSGWECPSCGFVIPDA